MLAEQDRYAEAMDDARKAVELARQYLPAEHPDRLSVQGQYAGILRSANRPTEAEPLVREVAAVQSRVLGPDHKDTLLTEYSLADILLAENRNAESAELALAVAHGLEAAVGPDNLYTLGAWLVHGIAACNAHADDAAIAVLRRVEAGRRKINPNGNWTVDSAGVSLGICLYQAHRYAEAQAQLMAAVAGLEAARGPGFHRTQTGYATLRDVCLAQGKTTEAARWASKLTPKTADRPPDRHTG
jgi:tetratricopeptide (TPR) repeat protein